MLLQNVSYITDYDTRLATVVANTAAETTFLSRTISASFLKTFTAISFKSAFMVNTAALLPPTLTINMRFGTTNVLAILSAQLMNAGIVNKTLVVEGSITNQAAVNSQTALGEIRLPATPILNLLTQSDVIAATSPWTTDTTASQLASLTAKFGTASASNTIQMIRGIMTFG